MWCEIEGIDTITFSSSRFRSLLLHLILFHQHLYPMDQASDSQHQLFKKQSCEHCRQINDFLLQANQNQYWRLETAQSSSISYSSQTALSRILQVYVGHFLQRLRTLIYNTKGMNSSNKTTKFKFCHYVLNRDKSIHNGRMIVKSHSKLRSYLY